MSKSRMSGIPLNRRDFLRLAGLLPLTVATPGWARQLSAPAGQQNVIIVLFDAFSAHDISLYGYARDTTPNIARLAKRAVVYHNHYASGNFTTPGTASLLTGALPWSHRAFQKNAHVEQSFAHRTLFETFGDYYRLAYAHNPLAFTLLDQFRADIDDLPSIEKLLIGSYDSFLGELFKHDNDISNVAWVRNTKLLDGYGYSLFFSHLDGVLQGEQEAQLADEFPQGVAPWLRGQYYRLEDAVDWMSRTLVKISQPFLSYFHFLPPHDPYRPPWEFVGRFVKDGYQPVEKPFDEFGDATVVDGLLRKRAWYDQFILYVDREFGRLHDLLERSGLLDNTWLILTSDHGEMFERGIRGHTTYAMYQPVVHVPLVIFEPGRRERMDIHTPTSAVDLLPTLAQVTGHPIPAWAEGTVLPPYNSAAADPNRSVYSVQAVRNDPRAPLTRASIMLVKGGYELVDYFGYGDRGVPDHTKLFDLQADPEELTDLYSAEKNIAAQLRDELESKLAEVNKPFGGGS